MQRIMLISQGFLQATLRAIDQLEDVRLRAATLVSAFTRGASNLLNHQILGFLARCRRARRMHVEFVDLGDQDLSRSDRAIYPRCTALRFRCGVPQNLLLGCAATLTALDLVDCEYSVHCLAPVLKGDGGAMPRLRALGLGRSKSCLLYTSPSPRDS
eukprot:TRINITY_DN45830_c0_g2_i1.p2 TRINITY_DN45830_c0_g2~~TRINITY_DN45830_c0_g2_i1.p2  ORF type:complete len:157 (-),score=27.83 TRINITY_DN45830_c0_g2_i1:116-586(-)